MNCYGTTDRRVFKVLIILCVSMGLIAPQSLADVTPKATGKIAFSSNRAGGSGYASEIFAMNADGSGQTQLTTTLGNSASQIDWSPDGNSVAFTMPRFTGSTKRDIWIARSNGSDLVNLTSKASKEEVRMGDNSDPAWSPDGKRIAFTSNEEQTDPQIGNVYIISVDGSDLKPVTGDRSVGWDPTWSPDGKQIAFIGDMKDIREGFGLIVTSTDGRVRKLIARPGDLHNLIYMQAAEWSPDGKRIAYVDITNLYTVNAKDGSSRELQTVMECGSSLSYCDKVSWSPSGDLIAYGNYVRSDPTDKTYQYNHEIFAVSTDGRGVKYNLTNNPNSNETNPDWSPHDGNFPRNPPPTPPKPPTPPPSPPTPPKPPTTPPSPPAQKTPTLKAKINRKGSLTLIVKAGVGASSLRSARISVTGKAKKRTQKGRKKSKLAFNLVSTSGSGLRVIKKRLKGKRLKRIDICKKVSVIAKVKDISGKTTKLKAWTKAPKKLCRKKVLRRIPSKRH